MDMYDLTLRPGPELIYGFPEHTNGALKRRAAVVTDKAHRFLFQPVRIAEDVSLADVLRLFEVCPQLLDNFRLQYAEQLCAEAAKGPLPEGEGSEANDPQPLEALELCWNWGLDAHTGEYSSVNTLDLNGLGPVLSADDPNERLKAGERVRWSVSLMPVRELLRLPVVVRPDFEIQESDVYAKAYGRPVGLGRVSEVTLGQVLRGLLTELCFHGSPADKAQLTAELSALVAEIDAGTAELKDAEDAFEELGFGDARVFEAMFESTGGLSRREVRWALGQVEDTEPVGPALEAKFGGRVVVRQEFRDLGGREFRRQLAQWRQSRALDEPGKNCPGRSGSAQYEAQPGGDSHDGNGQ